MLKKNLLILALILLISTIFWSSFFFQETFASAVSSLEQYIETRQILGAAVFVGLAALSAMLSPFSSIPLIPAAALVWGNVLTFFYLLAGWLIGGILTYLIGVYLGHPILRRLTPFQKIESYRRRLPEHIQFLLVFLFRLALPAEIPGYALGILRYSFAKYFLATLFAEALFAYLAINASYAFTSRRPAIFIFSVIAGIFILSFAFYLFQKYLKK